MKRFWATVFLALVIVGGSWILLNQDRIREAGGLRSFISQRTSGGFDGSNGLSVNGAVAGNQTGGQFRQASNSSSGSVLENRSGGGGFYQTATSNRIRIASFKLASTAATHHNPAMSIGVIADICRRNDLVAFQEVDGHRPGWLDELVTEIARQSNGQALYKHASDHVRVARNEPQFAFVYNTATLDLEVGTTYTVQWVRIVKVALHYRRRFCRRPSTSDFTT